MSKPTREYVASGLGYTGIIVSSCFENDDIRNEVKKVYATLNTKGHNFSGLFNAFTERRIGEIVDSNFRDILHTVHADSGGLQIITRGMALTSAMKDDVYRTQAKLSDVGMCFDEIPLVTTAASGRGDTAARKFDPSLVEPKARETGQNVRRQIEVFMETEGTTSKPCLIVQGNDFDSMKQWTEYALAEIPQDLHQYICGLAVSGAALGNGALEGIKRAVTFPFLPGGFKYLHVLGVGAIMRMVPYAVLSHLYEDCHISYDSTTHTGALAMGQFYSKSGTMSITRSFTKEYHQIISEVEDGFGVSVDPSVFHMAVNSNQKTFKGDLADYHRFRAMYIAQGIRNFKTRLDSLMVSDDALTAELGNGKERGAFVALREVKSEDDYRAWENQFGRYVASVPIERVGCSQTTSLDDFC